MDEIDIMYDESEHTTTRFIGFVGMRTRFDVAITATHHFFGKRLVSCLQTGRAAILSAEEAENADYIAGAFSLPADEAEELSVFLAANL
jgi:hypothetical protein